MTLEVTNTLSGKREVFAPIEPPKVRMYVCGLTPYDHMHIGHARAYVAYDMMRRWLEHSGFDVTHIQNITDVDDKIIARAKESQEKDPIAFAARVHEECEKDFAALRLKRAHAYPKVSDNIPGIIRMTETLIARGHAYTGTDDDGQSVYFDVASDPDYGKLSHRKVEELLEGVRKKVAEGKRNAADFALWKAAKPGEISWDSPWGPGRPGWHIECSVMATEMLGNTIDIHGGGWDLIFPHHENELAQSESATGVEPFAKYWLHVGFLTVENEKMSKSLGNFVTVRALLGEWRPEVARLWFAGTHYRSSIDYSEAALSQAAKTVERFGNAREIVRHAREVARTGAESDADAAFRAVVATREDAFTRAMDADLNTPLALSHLLELVSDLNKYAASDPHRDALDAGEHVFLRLANLFDVLPEEATPGDDDVAPLMDLILEIRQHARKKKDFSTADLIRDRIAEIGYVIEDAPEGARWKRK